jgi:hypothetical protein
MATRPKVGLLFFGRTTLVRNMLATEDVGTVNAETKNGAPSNSCWESWARETSPPLETCQIRAIGQGVRSLEIDNQILPCDRAGP